MMQQITAELTVDVEHHVPHGRTDGLMETKPHLPASTQRMVIALRRGEKRTSHWSIPVEKTMEQINQNTPWRLIGRQQDDF